MASLDEEKVDVAFVERSASLQDQPTARMTAAQYLSTRFSTLKPTWTVPPNPIKLLGLLTRKNWLFFAVSGWAA
jgi:SHS family lactate transporter-like MFS transporter